MTFAFDLISDLHIESWNDFDWSGQPTAPYCIVAGDVARDRQVLIDTLTHLGQKYLGVFYIDGNDEHRYFIDNLDDSYQELYQQIEPIPNVINLHDNVVIFNNIAILAVNGWWTFDFDDSLDLEQCVAWYQDYLKCSSGSAANTMDRAYHDVAYLTNSIQRLQTHPDVEKIILVSHTVPDPRITNHDVDLVDTWRYNCLGNKHLLRVFDNDTENKIHTWCFGHYHKSVDRVINGVRYVNNCRGRGDTPWGVSPYYPRRIEV
jgi:hypothetical protein